MACSSLDRSRKLILVLASTFLLLPAFGSPAPEPRPADKASGSSQRSEEQADLRLEAVQPATTLRTPVAFSRLFLDEHGQPLIGAHSDEGVFRYDSENGWKRLTTIVEPEAIWAGKTGLLVAEVVGRGPAFEIKRFDLSGRLISAFPLQGRPGYVSGLVSDGAELVYVNDGSHEAGIISVYNFEGSLLRRFTSPLPARDPGHRALLNQAWIALGPDRNVLVAFRFEPRFRLYDAEGRILTDVTVDHPLVDARRQDEVEEIAERLTFDEEGRAVLEGFIYFTTASSLPNGGYILGFGDGSIVFLVSPRGKLQKVWQLTAGEEPCRTFDYWDANLAVGVDRLRVGAGSPFRSKPGRVLDFLLPQGAEEVAK